MYATRARVMGLRDLRERFDVPETTWHVYRTPAGRLTVVPRSVLQAGMVLLGRHTGGSMAQVRKAAVAKFGAIIKHGGTHADPVSAGRV